MARDNGALSRRQERTLDCWIHGVAHLVDEFGEREALKMMACVVLHMLQGAEQDAPDQPPTPAAVDVR